IELANRESRSSWRDFLLGLKARGLHGVEFVVADDHAGLRAALREVLAEAAYQRCYVHFLRNALDYVPRRVDDDCLQELRWLYDRRDLAEARRDLAAWLAKWSAKYSKLTSWVEDNIDETLTFYRLPRQHHKHLKSTNMLERLNEEIRRRTHVVRIFPNGESCLRLVRALAVETHENWLEQHRYLNMDDLREHKKEALRRAAGNPSSSLRRALPNSICRSIGPISAASWRAESDPQQREPRPRPGLFSLLRFDVPRGDCSNAGQRKATKASRLGASTSRSLVSSRLTLPAKAGFFRR